MSNRREALLGRFRAGSLDRIRKLTLALVELEQGRGSEKLVQEIGRELHTLKGESRMIGMESVADLAHAAEEALVAARAKDALPPRSLCAQVIGALEVAARSLRGELSEGPESATAFQSATRQMISAPDGPAPAPAPNAAPESTPEAAPAPSDTRRPSERWIQVGAARVDELCERLADFASHFRALQARFETDARRPAEEKAGRRRALGEAFDRCQVQLEDITGAAWALRLVPVEPTLSELVRHARELALSQGKRVRVVIEAGGAQVERSILDDLWEPLLHLVRNAIDHGIEPPEERGDKEPQALLKLHAEPIANSVVITVADDGRGIDPAVVRTAAIARGLLPRDAPDVLSQIQVLELLFMHGFSTRAQVTDVSGRGVGLDVVRSAVEALGGSVTMSSQPGRGTRFALTAPVTIGKERALVLECGEVLYAIPSRNVLEVIRLDERAVQPVAGGRVLRYREDAIPLRSMAATLHGEATQQEPWALVLESAGRAWAFTTSGLIGERELVRQPVDALIASGQHIGASATLDDGRLVLVLAVAGLVRRSEGRGAVVFPTPPTPPRRRRVLVVDDSAIIRDLLSEVLAAVGIDVEVAPDGRAALDLVHATRPDAVVLDIEMPEMDGFEVLRRIRSRLQNLPVIMLTTRASADDRRRAIGLGADAYLIKSEFRETLLVDTIRRFLGGAP